jgi:hypothetical protein
MPAFVTRTLPWPPGAPRETLPMAAEAGLRVTGFRALAADFEHHNVEHQEEARRSAAEGIVNLSCVGQNGYQTGRVGHTAVTASF